MKKKIQPGKAALSLLPSLHLKSLAFFLTVLILSTGCKKKLQDTITLPGNETKNGPIPPYVFDWETTTYMPSQPNQPGVNPVPMPWNSGTTAIDPNLVSDYHQSEGWELVWNTFGPTVLLNDPGYSYYFALYNKYRGLLRFYLWQGSTAVATSYVNHGLKLYGSSNSPMLNFNAQEIVNPTNQTQFTQVLNQQLNVSGGTWLVFQYDIAYDPGVASTSFPGFGLEWDAKWASVSQITLNGTQTGEIKGYVGNPNAGVFNFNNFIQTSSTTLMGAHGYGTYLQQLNPQSDKYTATVGNAVDGIVKGFFSAVLGGTASSQPINLTINTRIKLDGNIVASGGIINKKLVLPGQSNSQTADGNTPHYNLPMGIMSISNAPTVNLNIFFQENGWVNDVWGNEYFENGFKGVFTLDNNSYSIIWNPSVINSSPTGASIENLRIQIINIDSPWTSFGGVGGYVSIPAGYVTSWAPSLIAYDGTYDYIEHVGNYDAISSIPSSPLALYSAYNSFEFNTGVRISFDVVPNNGAPRSKIVKTFKANLITS